MRTTFNREKMTKKLQKIQNAQEIWQEWNMLKRGLMVWATWSNCVSTLNRGLMNLQRTLPTWVLQWTCHLALWEEGTYVSHQRMFLTHTAKFLISNVHTNRESVQIKLGVDTKMRVITDILEDQNTGCNEGFWWVRS